MRSKGRTSRVLRTAVVAVALAAAATEAAGNQPEERRDAPFAGLHKVANITTSNDDYSIWLHWEADEFEAQYPDGRPPFDAATRHPDDLTPMVTFHCRADGRDKGFAGPRSVSADGVLPMHPEAPGVPGPFNLRYWLLAAFGNEWERWPVRLTVDGYGVYDTEIRRQRIHYSFSRPELEIADMGRTAHEGLLRVASGEPWRLRMEGDGLHVDARLPVMTDAAHGARQMLRHCR